MKINIDAKISALNDVMKEFDPPEQEYVDYDKKAIDELESKIMDNIQAKLDNIDLGKPTEQEESKEENEENEENGEENNGDN